MSANDLPAELTQPEPRRDRWGRYLIVPPGAKKPTGYTRATTVAKALDDTSSLMKWGKRMTAIGLAARPDLTALVAAADNDDRQTIDELCERAAEAGGATIRRDLGTALHSLLEQHWTDPSHVMPAGYAADAAAVDAALAAAGLTVVDGLHERVIVHDTHRIAGRPDLVVSDGTTSYIADVKTGSSIRYGALGWAVQLAIYATADAMYLQGDAPDGSEDERLPWADVSTEWAVIIHVQPGSGECTLHRLDLLIGAEALTLALHVREIRRERPLDIWPAMPDVPDYRAQLVERVDAIKAAGAIGPTELASWPADVPTFRKSDSHTPGELDAIRDWCWQTEKAHGLPFPPWETNPYPPQPTKKAKENQL